MEHSFHPESSAPSSSGISAMSSGSSEPGAPDIFGGIIMGPSFGFPTATITSRPGFFFIGIILVDLVFDVWNRYIIGGWRQRSVVAGRMKMRIIRGRQSYVGFRRSEEH